MPNERKETRRRNTNASWQMKEKEEEAKERNTQQSELTMQHVRQWQLEIRIASGTYLWNKHNPWCSPSSAWLLVSLLALSCSTMFTEIHRDFINYRCLWPVPVHQLMAVLGGGESFLKVFANFRYPFSCIFKQAICFYCPSLITLRAKYTYVHVFVRLCA